METKKELRARWWYWFKGDLGEVLYSVWTLIAAVLLICGGLVLMLVSLWFLACVVAGFVCIGLYIWGEDINTYNYP